MAFTFQKTVSSLSATDEEPPYLTMWQSIMAPTYAFEIRLHAASTERYVLVDLIIPNGVVIDGLTI